MRLFLTLTLTAAFAAPLYADPDADARAALALALATNKRTAELEFRVAKLEAKQTPRVVGHSDLPDPMAPNGFWIRPGSAGPQQTSYVAPTITYASAYAHAKAGKRLVLVVGVEPLPVGSFYGLPQVIVNDAPAGTTPGFYQLDLDAAGNVIWWTPSFNGPAQPAPFATRGVVGSVPFAPGPVTWGTTRVTSAPLVGAASTSRSVGFQVGLTRTVAGQTGLFGGTGIVGSGGCANGQCGAPARGGLFGFGLLGR